MNLPQLFGKNDRLRRKELGLSQERLAELCQFHRTYIGLVERGGRNISLNHAYRLAKALDTEVSKLTGEIP